MKTCLDCNVSYLDFCCQWYVSEDEWPGAVYPDYCAGWVYVTTTATLAAVLAWAQEGEERLGVDSDSSSL